MSDTTLPEDHVELSDAPILTPDHVLPDVATVTSEAPAEVAIQETPAESDTAPTEGAADVTADAGAEASAAEPATADAPKPAKKGPAKAGRSRSGAKNQGPKKDGGARSKEGKATKEDDGRNAYRPADVLKRLNERPGVQRAYLSEAHSLLYHVRLVGLGPALAMLLSQHDHKSKRRIYWDISKWVFKEERIKGKNVRSLMESVVYGEPRFLIKATQSVVSYLEELVKLGQQEAQQPSRSKPHD